MKIRYKFRKKDMWNETVDINTYAEIEDFIRALLIKTIKPEGTMYVEYVRTEMKK